MQVNILAILIVAAAIADASKCPTINSTTTFNIASLSGDWYLKLETPESFFFPQKCTKATYGTPSTESIPVTKKWRYSWFPFSLFQMTTSYTDTASNTTLGTFKEKKQSWFSGSTSYQVLGTDLSTYAVFYTCSSHLIGKTEKVYVISNSTSDLSSTVINSVDTALSLVSINRTSLSTHDQSCWSK